MNARKKELEKTDPEYPKKPKNAYTLFTSEHRAAAKAEAEKKGQKGVGPVSQVRACVSVHVCARLRCPLSACLLVYI